MSVQFPTRRAALAGPLALLALASGARAADKPVFIVPIRLTGARILVSVTFAGRGPYDFIVDTGGVVSGIEDSLAQELALKPVRDVRLGSGAGQKEFPLYAATDVVVGGAFRQAQVGLFGLDRAFAPASGILAAGLITTVDTDIDFTANQLRIYPEGRGDRASYQQLETELRPSTARNGSPKIYVRGSVEGSRGAFMVDTGMPRQISLTPNARAWSRLWDDKRPYSPVPIRGIAGPERRPARVVRAKTLRIDEIDFPEPLVTLHDRSVHAGPDLDGIIGLDLLRRFDLSWDAAGKALWVKPNALPPKASGYNYSGIWLERDGDRVRVDEVSPGSPAAEAGVQAGDLLAPGVGLGQTARQFYGPLGATVTLEIERKGQRLSLPLTLRDYL